RGFTQDDAHVFCTEAQLADECLKINELILSTYADFGFEGELTIKLSTKPDKRVGTDEMWDHAERVMATVLAEIQAGGSNRIKTDLRNEKVNYKVREHSLAKIPALLVVGKKEAETHSVSIRRLGSDGQKVMPTDEALAALVEEATPPDVKRARSAA